MTSYRKKLIEVALPLDAINAESAREKSIRHGHPSTLHLWWSRKPLATCRAVLFAQIVDDPSEYMPDEKSADEERERLFDLIENLVLWENINNEEVLDRAKLEIARSVARDLGEPVPVGKEAIREFLATKAPPVLDPFAGGGSIPLEAQRLGLRAYASDLNPVAVLINKAMIEIPPKFANLPPIHPYEEINGVNEKEIGQIRLWNREWIGAEGLAEDVMYYGKLVRDEAYRQIGHSYPTVKITPRTISDRPDLKKHGYKLGDEMTVIAWIWARTVKCPNPVCTVHMPLVYSFVLSKKGKDKVWIKPNIDTSLSPAKINFSINTGNGKVEQGTVDRTGARCIVCDTPVPFEYIRSEGKAGRMGVQLLAIATEGIRGPVFFSPLSDHEQIALNVKPLWEPDTDLPDQALGFRVQLYGMTKHSSLFTKRQLLSLSTFADLNNWIRQIIIRDAMTKGMERGNSLHEGGLGAEAYADAVITYLACAIDRSADYWSSLALWAENFVAHTFGRQTLSMIWAFAEVNPFSDSTGNWIGAVTWIRRVLDKLSPNAPAFVTQENAMTYVSNSPVLISFDPPYYDNVGYADLSDFFYVWLRRSLGRVYPSIFGTLLTPKSHELIADSSKHSSNEEAREFFEDGMVKVFSGIRKSQHDGYPMTVYYAFKQAESEESGSNPDNASFISSTGWETMLEGLMSSDMMITGTWPMRTERPGRLRETGSNALASSIVLVCRSRPNNSVDTTRREFFSMLKRELPIALRQLQQGSVAPVDLAQAAIGPGMSIFSRYKRVLEADGSPMRVRTALALINQALDEFLAEQEGEYDADTRWALAWYEQYGFNDGPFGVAETLSKAKNTSVGGLGEAGILLARAGKVRLLSRTELKEDWDPSQDKRPTAWEAVQYLIRALDTHGEQGAALLLSRLGGLGEVARDLAYRLYTICERKGWAQDALGYNMLVVAWPRLKEMARSTLPLEQGRLGL
jgi:putative DNA methylase